jgi:hypothetical protein
MSLHIHCLIAAALLWGSPSPSPVGAADEAYDLRGPAPKKGLVTRDTFKFTLKDADIAIDIGKDVTLKGKMDMTSLTEKEEEVLAVDGRNVTRLRTKLIKDETVRKTKIAGETQNETDKKALTGEIIFSELTKKGWKHSLEDATPNDKQKKELKDFDNPENDDDLYPAEKVKPGHAWDIDPQAFKKVLGSKMTDAKGTGKAKFLRVEMLDGEPCAVIEMDIDMKAKLKQEDSDFEVDMKGKVLLHRSIADAIDRKFTIDGTTRFKGTVEEDEMKLKMDFSGKMSGAGNTKVLKK